MLVRVLNYFLERPMLMRVPRLPKDEQQIEYNGQDHPLTSSDPGGTRIYNPYQSFISSIEIT